MAQTEVGEGGNADGAARGAVEDVERDDARKLVVVWKIIYAINNQDPRDTEQPKNEKPGLFHGS